MLNHLFEKRSSEPLKVTTPGFLLKFLIVQEDCAVFEAGSGSANSGGCLGLNFSICLCFLLQLCLVNLKTRLISSTKPLCHNFPRLFASFPAPPEHFTA